MPCPMRMGPLPTQSTFFRPPAVAHLRQQLIGESIRLIPSHLLSAYPRQPALFEPGFSFNQLAEFADEVRTDIREVREVLHRVAAMQCFEQGEDASVSRRRAERQ